MAKLFVSYSRRDSAAARRLIESFKSMGQGVDWEAIPPAVDWLEQIFRGIEEADAFIFMISPDSIASEVCKVEVNRAILNNKRIIPIVLRDVNPRDTLDDIRKLNWTFIREFVVLLCDRIKMRRYGKTQVVFFGDEPRVQGFSMIQLIETSLISAHFADASQAIYLDMFSCAPYDSKDAAMFAADYFKAAKYHYQVVHRQ